MLDVGVNFTGAKCSVSTNLLRGFWTNGSHVSCDVALASVTLQLTLLASRSPYCCLLLVLLHGRFTLLYITVFQREKQ